MSQLPELVKHIIIGVPLVGVVIAAIRWIFGPGLAFKIFAVVTPVIFAVGMIAIAVTKMEIGSAAHIVSVVVICTVVVGGQYYLYRIIVTPLQDYSLSLTSSSSKLSTTAAQSSSAASEQSSMAAQISTTVEEINQASKASSESAQKIAEVSANALEQSRQGQKSVQETLNTMLEIGKVSQIVDMIGNLAEQSNLLAVNAGIEAAKAGDHGRGFTVVAAEVRNLATQSHNATKEIAEAIELTNTGRRSAESTSAVIQKLTGVVEDTTNRSRLIAEATIQQVAGIRQISDTATALSDMSRDTAAATQNVAQTAGDLEDLSTKLRMFVGGKKASIS